MSSSHPSRRLLATNGFAWHIYMPYHDACLKGNTAANSSWLLLDDLIQNACACVRTDISTND